MTTTDTKVNNVIINKLKHSQYVAARLNGDVSDTEGYDIIDKEEYFLRNQQGTILPNFDVMVPVKTIEYDVATTTYQQLFTRTNTETIATDLQDIVYCRITATGENINAKYDLAFLWKGQINAPVQMIAFDYPGTADAAYGGIRYIRCGYPKALNNGYDWIIDFTEYNENTRHLKIEVFKTNPKITWMETATNTTIDNTYSTNSMTLGNQRGLIMNDTVYIMASNANYANYAGYVCNYHSKYLINNGTSPASGAALLANQFTFMNGNVVYPATDKTKAIEPGYGILWNVTAYAANKSVSWSYLREKGRATSLTNVPHDTLVRGNPCYFRCTMDANGNILSDNYVTTSMSNGYTWYYIGIAESATAIAIDTSGSKFITLDSNGKLTHIDGKPIYITPTTDSVTSGSSDALTSGGAYTNLVRRKSTTAATGGTNQGVYVDANGQIQACNATTSTYSATGTTAVNGTAVASAISNKADKATTISGYGITDAYTKTEIDGKLSGAMHFKGTKASVSALPSSGNVTGDMWNVLDTGSNYAWDGTQWDKLSENIDLSGYVPTSRKINNKALTGDITLTPTDIGAAASSHNHNSGDITTLTGYSKATSSSAIATTDSLNTAIGKLEYKADNAVVKNTAITGATKCKITYDSKGLVTAGANLSASDIPSLTLSKISDVTATASEVNVLDGITATTEELNYVDGVTSSIQTQLDSKAADNSVVKLTGNQTIGGVKTFSDVIGTTAGKGISIKGTDHTFQIRSSGSPSNGCSLLVDNDTSKPAWAVGGAGTTITVGSNNVLPYSITPASSDNSTRIATTAFVQTAISGKADDSGVVHIAGNETITGIKTFTNYTSIQNTAEANIFINNTNADTLAERESTVWVGSIKFRGKNAAEIFNIRGALLTNGTQLNYNIRDYSDASKHLQASFSSQLLHNGKAALYYTVGTNGSSDTRTYVNECLSTASNSTTDVMIPTKGWVNNPTTSTNVVHRSGSENIAGIKRLTSNQLEIQNTKISYDGREGTTQNGQSWINFWTGDNRQTGYINSYLRSATQTSTSIAAYFTDGTDTNQAELRIIANKDGSKSSSIFPPTQDTTSSTQIDTVGARNTKLANYALDANVVHLTGDETIAGVKTFSNEPVIDANIKFSNVNSGTRGIWGQVGSNDSWRVVGGATATNAGYLELATADDYNEPIYVRQYQGGFATIKNEAILLDGSGNTSLPGELTIGSKINSPLTTSTYLLGNQGRAIINSTASAGGYTMIAKMNSTNGVFTYGSYGTNCLLQYTSNTTINNGTNSVDKQAILLSETGDTTLPGNLSVNKSINATENVSAGGTVSIGGHVTLSYNSTTESLDFIFS